MGALSQFLSHMYTVTMVFFSILLLELVILIRGAAGGTTKRRPITTGQFLRLVDQRAPTQYYKAGLCIEPVECRVCLQLYEEGDEIRRLKCKHAFHKDCLDTWLQQEFATCPLCRRRVLPEDVVVNHRLHRDGEFGESYYHDGSDEELVMLLYALHGNFLRRFL